MQNPLACISLPGDCRPGGGSVKEKNHLGLPSNAIDEYRISTQPRVPEDIRYQTAVLLATMVLHARREVRSI